MSITDREIVLLVFDVSPMKLRQIAVSYLGITEGRIETYEASARTDIDLFKFKIIEDWRNRNPGDNARKLLHGLLTKASSQGLIDQAVFASLLKAPGSGKIYVVIFYLLRAFSTVETIEK